MQLVLRGVANRRKAEFRQQCSLAYATALLHRFVVHDPNGMPSFDKAFPDGAPKRPKTPDEIMAVMQAHTARISR